MTEPTMGATIPRFSLLAAASVLPSTLAAQDSAPPESHDMRLVGYSDLQARTAYQPTIARQGARWILYVGHHGDQKLNPLTNQLEHNGTSILDVTDPAQP